MPAVPIQAMTEASELSLPAPVLHRPNWASVLEDTTQVSTILIIDDIDLNRRLLKAMLKTTQYRILEAERPLAAFQILEREKTLLSASRDIHDLMGARNLHIVDVLDVDSKGKDRRTFGRVFYTEGKSLIFYAFDLGDNAARKRNASFQVWGARGPGQTPAQNMGVFYVDDQKQNRWVLKFEDPRILAEIDSVFVTVEPPGGSARPTGRKFLYAYLKANPNHP